MAWFEPDRDEVEFLKEISRLSDRVVGLLAPILIERRLSSAIGAKRKNAKTGGQRSSEYSFGTQIDIGRKLGIYGEESHRDLRTVKDIRNHFAHELAAKDFTSRQIADCVKRLGIIDRWPESDPQADAKNEVFMPLYPIKYWLRAGAVPMLRTAPTASPAPEARYKFLRTCEMLSYFLHGAARSKSQFCAW